MFQLSACGCGDAGQVVITGKTVYAGMAIEEDDLRSLSFEALDEILDSIRNRRVQAYLAGLKGAVDNAG